MEQHSEMVAEGKWIGENTYLSRSEAFREVEVAGSKIDYYDPNRKIVHETKKSDKMIHAHIAQVKYYIWLLEQEGITGAKGVLEYPKQRRREEVALEAADYVEIPKWIEEVERIIASETCPPLVKKSICQTCSYYEFCYAE
jgi:CRISPR-associated exonuclease Cas4